jgi:hypothetical protein
MWLAFKLPAALTGIDATIPEGEPGGALTSFAVPSFAVSGALCAELSSLPHPAKTADPHISTRLTNPSLFKSAPFR